MLYGLIYISQHLNHTIFIALSCFCVVSMMKYHINKGLKFFFDLQADFHFVSLKNNLRTILGLKGNNFKNIEARQKLAIFNKILCNKSKCIITAVN